MRGRASKFSVPVRGHALRKVFVTGRRPAATCRRVKREGAPFSRLTVDAVGHVGFGEYGESRGASAAPRAGVERELSVSSDQAKMPTDRGRLATLFMWDEKSPVDAWASRPRRTRTARRIATRTCWLIIIGWHQCRPTRDARADDMKPMAHDQVLRLLLVMNGTFRYVANAGNL